MNEKFASEPIALKGHLAVKHLLDKFGPATGRYLTAYPADWRKQVLEVNARLGPVELKRVDELLIRARNELRVVSGNSMPFNSAQPWLDNAIPLLETRPRRHLAALIIEPRTPPFLYHDVHELEKLELPPTAEEQVKATPEEFLRVGRMLLASSPEIGLIDPYINPCNPYVVDVLKPMFKLAAAARCQSIRVWSRGSNVLHSHSAAQAEKALRDLIPPETPNGLTIELNLLDDSRHINRMHARYLLTLKGGIRFDQGFQKLHTDRLMDVVPITSKSVFNQVYGDFFENSAKNAWVVKTIMVTCPPTTRSSQ